MSEQLGERSRIAMKFRSSCVRQRFEFDNVYVSFQMKYHSEQNKRKVVKLYDLKTPCQQDRQSSCTATENQLGSRLAKLSRQHLFLPTSMMSVWLDCIACIPDSSREYTNKLRRRSVAGKDHLRMLDHDLWYTIGGRRTEFACADTVIAANTTFEGSNQPRGY